MKKKTIVKDEKVEFAKTMTEQETVMIKTQREVAQSFINNEDALTLAELNEDGFSRFEEYKMIAMSNLHKALSAKKEIDKLNRDITIGSSERKFNDGTPMDIRSLELLRLSYNQQLFQFMRDLSNNCLGIYKRIGMVNPVSMKKYPDDKSKWVYFTAQDWENYIASVKSELKKSGLDLYRR